MPEIADILVMFGKIDQIAGENIDNPRVEATVERLLPGTAGYQQGWYSQVERFLQSASGGDSSPLPDYEAAVNRLGITEQDPEWPIPQQAKARYSATVLAELFNVVENDGGPSAGLDFDALTRVLDAGRPYMNPDRTFAELVSDERPSHSGWRAFMAKAAQNGLVTDEESRLSPPARGKIRALGDEFCTQLDTPYEDPDLDLSDVRAIIDPQNWARCSKYWDSVTVVSNPPNPAGWTRIYEKVSVKTGLMNVTLTTPLIYRNHEVGGGIVVNYDLDTDTNGTQHDDFVCADSGYIWVTPLTAGPPQTGVRIRTRKVARIQGLGVAALAMYAYSMGWSTAGENLILDCAKSPPPKSVPFVVSGWATATTPDLSPKVPPIPNIREQDRVALVDKVVDIVNKTIKVRATKTGDFVQRWVDGELLPTDVAAANAAAATDLTQSHTKLHRAATQGVPSPKPQKVVVKKAVAKKKPPKPPPKKKHQ